VDALPDWPQGTVAVLCTAGGPPHAIPVSAVVKAGPRRVLLALGLKRESLARLRSDPDCALTVIAAGIAFTAHAHASILAAPMEAVDGVAAVALDVDDIQDHMQARFAIDAGVAWHWTQAEARERDAEVRAALLALVQASPRRG
jgi:hypothetical protein